MGFKKLYLVEVGGQRGWSAKNGFQNWSSKLAPKFLPKKKQNIVKKNSEYVKTYVKTYLYISP